jgi:Mn2+/Fe2+ NRAMP family transporter
MIGAVGGSLMNLAYPYFLDAKGWRGPEYRRVQTYDFLLGVMIMIVLNLAVWTLGAELLHPTHQQIQKLDDLPGLLSTKLGQGGRLLFYAGIFAAIYTSIVGHAVGLGSMGVHAWVRWQAGKPGPRPTAYETQLRATAYRAHPLYKAIIVWLLVSPLLWTIDGAPDFVTLTLTANSAQVVLLPVLAGGLWYIASDHRFIGLKHQNSWWENVLMSALFWLAIWGAFKSVENIWAAFQTGAGGH